MKANQLLLGVKHQCNFQTLLAKWGGDSLSVSKWSRAAGLQLRGLRDIGVDLNFRGCLAQCQGTVGAQYMWTEVMTEAAKTRETHSEYCLSPCKKMSSNTTLRHSHIY